MKENKLLNLILTVAWILQLAVECMTAVMICRLDMLPAKLLIPVLILLLMIWLICGILMLLRIGGRQPGAARVVIGGLLALVTVAGCAAAAFVVAELEDTMNTISKPNQQTTTGVSFAVYVPQEDPAQTLPDTKGYTFLYVDGYETDRTNRTVEAIGGKLGSAIDTVGCATVQDVMDNLTAEGQKALILNSAYVALLSDMEEYESFIAGLRLLERIELKDAVSGENSDPEVGSQAQRPAYTPEKPHDITNTPFVLYLSGSDTRSSNLTTSNSDVNILAVVNPETKQVLLVNTPRDYFLPNPVAGGAMDKLTHFGAYGVDCSMEALGELYGVSVQYYAQINFNGFKTLIDALGGVVIHSDVAFTARDTYIQVGDNWLNGSQALDFARERYHLAQGDNDRGKNQMKVIKAVIAKLTSGSTVITRYAEILDSLEGMFVTDFERSEMNKLVKMQLSDMASWNVLSFAVTGEGDSRITYSLPGISTYVMYQDEELVAQASVLIDRVMAGEILTEEDVKPVH